MIEYEQINNPFEGQITLPAKPDVNINQDLIVPHLNFVGNSNVYDKDYNNYNFYALGAHNKQQDDILEQHESLLNVTFSQRRHANERAELVWHSYSNGKDYGIYGFNDTEAGVKGTTNQNFKFIRNGVYSGKVSGTTTPLWTTKSGDSNSKEVSLTKNDTGLVLRWLPYSPNNAAGSRLQTWGQILTFVPAASIIDDEHLNEETSNEHISNSVKSNGLGTSITLISQNFSRIANKYLYISKDHISFPYGKIGGGATRYDYNKMKGETNGIKWDNSNFVLTEVYIIH